MTASFPTSIKSFTTKQDNVTQVLAEHINSPQEEIVAIETMLGVNGAYWIREGALMNGIISATVASNNLTVALKGIDGNAPSATNPIYIRINNAVVKVTAVANTSLTINAGTNWGNAGGAELATKEVDWFVYLFYKTSTASIVLGISRIPYGNIYSDFSGTATNEKAVLVGTAPAATDKSVVIGRFAATLSAGAGYTWTVPTFTASNLIQRPIYNTRWLPYTSTVTWTGGAAPTTPSITNTAYRLDNDTCMVQLFMTWTNAGTTITQAAATLPFTAAPTYQSASGFLSNGSATGLTYADISSATIRLICGSSTINRYNAKSTYQY